MGTSTRLASASMTGITRRCSSAPSTVAAPGRVDSPPTSMMAAPSSAIRTPASTAASRSKSTPPSEKESGVTLITPMMSVRSPSTSVRPRGSGIVNRRRGSTGERYNRLFLRNGTRWNRRNDCRARLLRLRRGRRHLRRRRRRGRWLVQRLAGHDAAHLFGVERFVREQRVGHLHQPRLVLHEDLVRAVVRLGDEALHLVVDLQRGVLAVILVLRDLAAEEDLLLLLAEGERSHRVAHAPLAHHAARELRGALEIVAGARGEAIHRDLLGDAAAEQDRDLVVQVIARVIVLLVGRKLLRQSERHAARD